MKRVSSVGIRGPHARLLTGILFAPALTIAVPAAVSLQGLDLLIAIVIVALIVLSIIFIYLMKVTIDVSDTEVVVAFRPFFVRKLALDDITTVTFSPPTSLQEGFGYRILENNQRGLLVGGPSIAICTSGRTWVVSTANPSQAIEYLSAQLPERRNNEECL